MARYQISLRQGDIPADHIERRMAEDLLEAEHIATVDEVDEKDRRTVDTGRGPPAEGPRQRKHPDEGYRAEAGAHAGRGQQQGIGEEHLAEAHKPEPLQPTGQVTRGS